MSRTVTTPPHRSTGFNAVPHVAPVAPPIPAWLAEIRAQTTTRMGGQQQPPAEPLPNIPPGNLREPPDNWPELAEKRWGGVDPTLPNIVVDSSPTRAELVAIFEAMGLEPLEGEPGTWIDPTDPLARLI